MQIYKTTFSYHTTTTTPPHLTIYFVKITYIPSYSTLQWSRPMKTTFTKMQSVMITSVNASNTTQENTQIDIDTQLHRQIDRQIDIKIDGNIVEEYLDRHRQIDRQIDSQIDIKIDRNIDRQSNKWLQTQMHITLIDGYIQIYKFKQIYKKMNYLSNSD